MTSVWFGLGHDDGGVSSGAVGAIQAGLLTLLPGKAMLDTGGMGWPWFIHFRLEAVIDFFIAATMG